MSTATITLNFPELKAIRAKRGQSQEDVGLKLSYSRQMVQKIENGTGKIQDQDAARFSRELDDPELYLTLLSKVTGGVMTAPYLDNIDNHRLVVGMKFIEETQESIEAMQKIIPVIIRAQDKTTLNSEDKSLLMDALHEGVEAITATVTMLGTLAKTYGVSLADLWDEHRSELLEKGYIKRKSRL